MQALKKCMQKNLELGPYSKLWKAEHPQHHPAVIEALNTTPNTKSEFMSTSFEFWTNMYKQCDRLDQQQLKVIRSYGMEFSIIDCRLYDLQKACNSVHKQIVDL